MFYVDTDRIQELADAIVENIYRKLQISPTEAIKQQIEADEGVETTEGRIKKGEKGLITK